MERCTHSSSPIPGPLILHHWEEQTQGSDSQPPVPAASQGREKQTWNLQSPNLPPSFHYTAQLMQKEPGTDWPRLGSPEQLRVKQ